MPILTLIFKNQKVREYPLYKDRTVTIGRKESNDIVITNLGVSGSHARIDSKSDRFTLTDLGSTNGTFVNRKLVSTCLLNHDDVILIGKHELHFDGSDLEVNVSGYENDDTEKTLHLDTSEYRKLIDQAKKEAEENKNLR